jgi:hypothetical protein
MPLFLCSPQTCRNLSWLANDKKSPLDGAVTEYHAHDRYPFVERFPALGGKRCCGAGNASKMAKRGVDTRNENEKWTVRVLEPLLERRGGFAHVLGFGDEFNVREHLQCA